MPIGESGSGREITEGAFHGRVAGRDSVFDAFVCRAKEYFSPFNANVRRKLSVIFSLVYSGKSGGAVDAQTSVHCILRRSSVSEVLSPVIERIAICVVHDGIAHSSTYDYPLHADEFSEPIDYRKVANSVKRPRTPRPFSVPVYLYQFMEVVNVNNCELILCKFYRAVFFRCGLGVILFAQGLHVRRLLRRLSTSALILPNFAETL